MDKIKYILALTNVKMTDEVKMQINNRLRTAIPDVRAKKNKKIKKIISAVTLSVLAVAAVAVFSAVLLPKLNNNPGGAVTDSIVVTDNPGGAVTDNFVITNPPSTYPPETSVITDPPYNQTEFRFKPLYAYHDNYKPLRMALSLMTPTQDGEIVYADSLYPLYDLFGTNDADEICSTVFAFYEKGKAVRFDEVTSAYSEEALFSGQEFADVYGIASHKEEIIISTCKQGTFEYLLTLSVIKQGSISDAFYRDTGAVVFNFNKEIVGTYSAENVLSIQKDKFTTLSANIYKVRFENSTPVIYQKIPIQVKDYYPTVKDAYSSSISSVGFNFNYATNELISAIFDLQSGLLIFNPYENDMFETVCRNTGKTGADNADSFLYSYPNGEETAEISRKTVCEIINRFGLQWFFPYYVNMKPTGCTVIGSGIKTFSISELLFLSSSSSLVQRDDIVYGAETYLDMSGNKLYDGFYYNPETCDRPYFNLSDDNAGLPVYEIDIVNGTMRKLDNFGADTVPDLEELPAETEGGFVFDCMCMADTKNISAHPFTGYAADLLPFCSDFDTFAESELTDKLGLKRIESTEFKINESVYRDMRIVTRRKMYAADVMSFGIIRAANGEPRRHDIVTAYEKKGRYIADVHGQICGYMADDNAVYSFHTAIAYFELYVISTEDGGLLYMGPTDQCCVNEMLSSEEFDRFERTESGTFMGSFVHAVNLIGSECTVNYAKHDGAETYVSVVWLYSEPTFLPLRYDGFWAYKYLGERIIKRVSKDVCDIKLYKDLFDYEQGRYVLFARGENDILIEDTPDFYSYTRK